MRNLLKILSVGITSGALLALLLAYPVYNWLLSAYVSPARVGPHPLLIAGLGLLAALALGAAGKLAAAWTRARAPWERLAAGAATGGLTGFALYAGLGAAMAGIAGQAPLYDVILSFADISPGESLLKLAIAINQTFPTTFQAFWLLIGGGTLIAGLAAWRRPKPMSTSIPISIPIAITIASACLVVSVCLNMLTFPFLGKQLQLVFDTFGFAPRWDPLWIWPSTMVQPWLALMLLAGLALRTTLRQSALQRDPTSAWLAPHIAGIQNCLMLVLLLLWVQLNRPDRSLVGATLYLITVVVTLELLLASRQLEKSEPEGTAPTRAAWFVGGAAGGLLAAPLNFQWVSLVISLIVIAWRTVGLSLGVPPAPPADVAWLEQLFFWPLIKWQILVGLVLLCVHALGGGLTGLGLRMLLLREKPSRLSITIVRYIVLALSVILLLATGVVIPVILLALFLLTLTRWPRRLIAATLTLAIIVAVTAFITRGDTDLGRLLIVILICPTRPVT